MLSIKQLQNDLSLLNSFNKDFDSSLTHALKTLGKLSIVADKDNKDVLFIQDKVEQYIADLVICAIIMANTYTKPVINLDAALMAQINTQNNMKQVIDRAIVKPYTISKMINDVLIEFKKIFKSI